MTGKFDILGMWSEVKVAKLRAPGVFVFPVSQAGTTETTTPVSPEREEAGASRHSHT